MMEAVAVLILFIGIFVGLYISERQERKREKEGKFFDRKE